MSTLHGGTLDANTGMVIGVVLFIAGLAMTLASFYDAGPGGSYILWYGAMVGGVVLFVRGFLAYREGRWARITRAREAKRRSTLSPPTRSFSGPAPRPSVEHILQDNESPQELEHLRVAAEVMLWTAVADGTLDEPDLHAIRDELGRIAGRSLALEDLRQLGEELHEQRFDALGHLSRHRHALDPDTRAELFSSLATVHAAGPSTPGRTKRMKKVAWVLEVSWP